MITQPEGSLAMAAGNCAARQRSTSAWMVVTATYFSRDFAINAASTGGAELPKCERI